ncbi:MAG: flagellar M-ring protein FliF [Bradyrhizobiaceae bacterium]|nr:flagellar M-ring protein FliF [Bradyrhizobiaceae bacterium]
MNGLVEFVKALGAARVAAMAAVTAALIGFFVIIILRITTPAMAPLFTELTIEDSNRVVKELESQGLAYELRGDGSTILIPKDQVTRMRMRLAEAGLPRGGSVGYEIFDKSDTLGTTSFVQNVNHLRALEGELARTIRSIDRVAAARVHLVIPERQLFQRDRQEPSASIVLRVRSQLESSQVRAVRHLVASAVRGLKPERVSIVDEQGRLLADGIGVEQAGIAPALDERNVAFEQRVKNQIESILSSVVGPGRARVTVHAELDYTRIQQTSDRFDPESRVVRSTQSREEAAQSNEASQTEAVSVGRDLPGGNQQQGGGQQGATKDSNRKNEEIVNYEISRTTRTEVIEPGRIKRLSVAVVVDGNYKRGASNNNEVTYEPRSQEELDRLTALVRSAIGFDEKRGDQVEVVNLRFAEAAGTPQIVEDGGFLSMFRFTTDDIMHAVNLLVVAILSLLVLLFIVRPLVRRVVTPDESIVPALPASAAEATLVRQEGESLPAPAAEPGPRFTPDFKAARQIEFAQVQGEAHQQSIQKVGELASRNPYETVSILRQWMHEKSA